MEGPIRSGILNATPLIGVTSSQGPECLGTPTQTLLVFEMLGLPEAVEWKPKFREQFATLEEPSLRNAVTGLEESRPSPVAPVLLYLAWMTLRHGASKIQSLTTFPLTQQRPHPLGLGAREARMRSKRSGEDRMSLMRLLPSSVNGIITCCSPRRPWLFKAWSMDHQWQHHLGTC